MLLEHGKPGEKYNFWGDSERSNLSVVELEADCAVGSLDDFNVDAGPPFSPLFTLWLSMMAAVGLASRRSCSRHRS